MGDSETLVTPASADMEYPSGDYKHVTSNAMDENVGDQTTYSADPNIIMQEAPITSTEDGGKTIGVDIVQENLQAGVYDSSVNGNGTTNHDANGNVQHASGEAVGEQPLEADSVFTAEERLWSIVKSNSLDFNAWTALIEETEKVAEDNISKIEKVYDAFLAEFPLCYGYWKKYADHEARLASVDKVVEVYERAVVAVTYSVDIWLHYCVFSMSTNYEDPETVRRLFDRGLAYVGTDYLSYPLWDKFIEYEYSQQEWGRLATIYTQILESPNQQLDRYFTSFKELAGSRPLSEIRTAEEVSAAEASGQGVESEVHPDDPEYSLKPVSAGLTETEELEKYVAVREEMYKKAKEFDSKIAGFETAIRRPYFHVRPLNSPELENWHNYLDFIEGEDNFYKVVKLYERCLIACANYPEFWIRYVLSMEVKGSMDLANNALARATQVFVKRQPEIHLFAARFREQSGDIQEARAAYQLVHSGISPGLLEAITKHANMEHRLGNMEEAFSLYEQAIATEKGKEQSQILPMLFVQYSRFLYLVAGEVEKSREVLVGALEHIKLSKAILEAFIHLESIQSVPKRIDYLDSLVEKYIMPSPDINNSASTTDREEVSSIFVEFLGLFGDTQSIKKAEDRHSKLFLCHRSTNESRKRSAEDLLASDKAKLAKSYGGPPSPAPSAMGAYPAAQNMWPAGYGSQPQAWNQASQAQGQQWNTGYTQQAGYAGYSSYGGGYAHPQVPAPAPQSATAYGAYTPAPAYPTQPYVQQPYAQPVVSAAAVVPTHPQAPVPQAAGAPAPYYSGSFY
ncbi:hypothetical protein MKX01_015471 [Papaver californicum]|nr:hypothetical protein MKX01_015471 [Papaver californicum]